MKKGKKIKLMENKDSYKIYENAADFMAFSIIDKSDWNLPSCNNSCISLPKVCIMQNLAESMEFLEPKNQAENQISKSEKESGMQENAEQKI